VVVVNPSKVDGATELQMIFLNAAMGLMAGGGVAEKVAEKIGDEIKGTQKKDKKKGDSLGR